FIGGAGVNCQILEWARHRPIPFPDPAEATDCLDKAASTQVLNWWLKYYFPTVDPDDIGHSILALELATENGVEKKTKDRTESARGLGLHHHCPLTDASDDAWY
ncbi:hypothetical protein BCR44DRAFT_1438630, partial [Catenaria anguillulae PL171]